MPKEVRFVGFHELEALYSPLWQPVCPISILALQTLQYLILWKVLDAGVPHGKLWLCSVVIPFYTPYWYQPYG